MKPAAKKQTPETPKKKAWATPSIRRLEDGVVVTGSGAKVQMHFLEGPTYRPPS